MSTGVARGKLLVRQREPLRHLFDGVLAAVFIHRNLRRIEYIDIAEQRQRLRASDMIAVRVGEEKPVQPVHGAYRQRAIQRGHGRRCARVHHVSPAVHLNQRRNRRNPR